MREKQLPVNEHVFNALIMGHSQAEYVFLFLFFIYTYLMLINHLPLAIHNQYLQ